MALSDFFSSVFSTIHADSEEKVPEPAQEKAPEPAEEEETPAPAEEEEEEEPEDLQPIIRDECKEKKCAQLAAHFDHCQEKVESGKGFPHEDCVEELMMHCIDDCAAPKLFSKLR